MYKRNKQPKTRKVICGYCKKQARLVKGHFIYKNFNLIRNGKNLSDKNFYYCDNEHEPAYVGCHEYGERSLGTLANYELRELRKQAHSYFDPLWRYDDNISRKQAYKWLSQQLGIPVNKTHIGQFNEEMCLKVIDLCNKHKIIV